MYSRNPFTIKCWVGWQRIWEEGLAQAVTSRKAGQGLAFHQTWKNGQAQKGNAQRRCSQKEEGRGEAWKWASGVPNTTGGGTLSNNPCHLNLHFLNDTTGKIVSLCSLLLLPLHSPFSPSSFPLPSPLSFHLISPVFQCPGASGHWGLAAPTEDTRFTISTLGSSYKYMWSVSSHLASFNLVSLYVKWTEFLPQRFFKWGLKLSPTSTFGLSSSCSTFCFEWGFQHSLII